MSDYIEVLNEPIEYFKNGSVKAYSSHIRHTELNKVITVKHREHDVYMAKFQQAVDLLNFEWEIDQKNQYIKQIYYIFANLTKLSLDTHVSYKELYIRKQNIEFDKSLPTPPIKPSEILDFDINSRPLEGSFPYVYNPTLIEYIVFPILLIRRSITKSKFKNAVVKYTELSNKQNNYEHQLRTYNTLLEQYNNEFEEYISLTKEEEERVNKHNNTLNSIYENYLKNNEIETTQYFERMLKLKILKYLNLNFEIEYSLQFFNEDSSIVIDFNLPESDFFPKVKEYKYLKSELIEKPQFYRAKEYNELVMNSYYNLFIAILNDIFQIDDNGNISKVILNGIYKGIDARTGKNFTKCILTAIVERTTFLELVLERIDARECFKYLKGKGIPNPDNLVEVEPIRFLDKDKYRLIDSDNILRGMSLETNLAAMPWQDFETLVKDLFELEFEEQDIEIRNTQHSNDGGIDVIAFNRNQYSGGIIVLQAKRYTNTVTPEPVRALKGTMQDVNAIRGILVTTSDYGKTSYDFAKANNITLINGIELVSLLSKHGYDFHIDLKQAKEINSMN